MRLISSLVAINVVFLASITFYCIKPKQSVVRFDAEAIRGQLIRQLAEHKVSDKDVSIATKKFNHSLSALLIRYAKEHRVVILNSPMILAGGEDVTEHIARELSDVMRARS